MAGNPEETTEKKKDIPGTDIATDSAVKNSSITKCPGFPPAAGWWFTGTAANFPRAASVLIRKSIHLLIALSPVIASFSRPLIIILLSSGIAVYTVLELLRMSGIKAPLISYLTDIASHQRDHGHFVLGPVTLGSGALLALLLFPLPAASIGIYALAFGDGLAGIAGKLLGRLRPRFLCGKSIEGSLACLAASFSAAILVSHNVPLSLAAALTAAITEALPLKDYDNLVLPLAVCAAVQYGPVIAGSLQP